MYCKKMPEMNLFSLFFAVDVGAKLHRDAARASGSDHGTHAVSGLTQGALTPLEPRTWIGSLGSRVLVVDVCRNHLTMGSLVFREALFIIHSIQQWLSEAIFV